MHLLKDTLKRIILIVVLMSTLLIFFATPASYAKLDLKEGDFYYSGTTKGTYSPKENIFSWILGCIGDIADWIIGVISFGFRMVFVGWTALAEKILTWALESTTGVNSDGGMVTDSNDLTDLSDSSNNVTVEAIVYNRVPALNIDFFDLKYDRTVSGTGKILVCDDCQKPVNECITGLVEGNVPENTKCGCAEEQCYACETYIEQMAAEKPLLIVIRELVAMWYTIIRALAMAAMLVVLIAVGIKMATSTIASDKAVYKRMLVDWVVGVIILFMLHYFMIFVINMNGVMLGVIEEASNSINDVKMQQLTKSESELTNSEIEIKVYEEIRTRAYDAKMVNGTIGMVMYMTMVFFAFKYTIIYLKRYLTILVLTLMGPGVGVAYALQKVLSGKSQALKTWMTEYIMNVIIQIVHALIYAIFISQAMVLSLQSVAGMIIALILMNYTSKADSLFKKVFKFGGGDSLLGHTEGAMDSAKQSLQSAKGIVTGSKPLAKALTNTPYGIAVKGAGKALLAAGVGVARLARNLGTSKDDKFKDDVKEEMEKSGGYEPKVNPDGTLAESLGDYADRKSLAEKTVLTRNSKSPELDAELLHRGGTRLRADVEAASAALQNAISTAKDNGENPNENANVIEHKKMQMEALAKYDRFQQITNPTAGQILVGRANRIIDMENTFENTTTKSPVKLAWKAAFGTTRFNTKTFRFENDGSGIYNQFTPTNLLGLTTQDKKAIKEMSGDMLKGLGGIISLGVGLGTVVAEPKLGFGLLAAGKVGVSKVFAKDPKVSTRSGKYSFSGYGAHSIDTIRNSALVRAKQEHDQIVATGIEMKYPSLAEKLKNGKASAMTIGSIGGELGVLFATQNSPYSQTATLSMMEDYQESNRRRVVFSKNTVLSGKMDTFAKNYAKQQRQQIDKFNKEAFETQKTIIEATQEYHNEKLEQEELIEILKEQGYDLDPETNEIYTTTDADSADDDNDIYKVVLLAAEKELREAREGSGTTEEENIQKKYEIQTDEINTNIGTKHITQTDVDLINKELDMIIIQVSEGKEVDISSQKIQAEIMDKLSAKLEKAGLLGKNQNAEILFKHGKEGLKKALKRKADKRNRAVEFVEKKLQESFTPEGAAAIAGAITQASKDAVDNGKDPSKVSINDVLSNLDAAKDGSIVAKRPDSSNGVASKDGRRATTREATGNVPTRDGTRGASTRDGSSRVNASENGSKVNASENGSKVHFGEDASRVSTSDGSRNAGSTVVLDEKQKQLIEQYIQVTRTTAPQTAVRPRVKVESERAKEIIKAARPRAEASAETKRKTKLQQAVTVLMGVDDVINPEPAPTQTKKSAQDILNELSNAERDYVTNTARNLLQIMETNKESQRVLRDKPKNKDVANMEKEASKKRIEIATSMKERLILEGQPQTPNSQARIDEITRNIDKTKKELIKTDKQKDMKGPIMNVEKFIQEGFSNKMQDGNNNNKRNKRK